MKGVTQLLKAGSVIFDDVIWTDLGVAELALVASTQVAALKKPATAHFGVGLDVNETKTQLPQAGVVDLAVSQIVVDYDIRVLPTRQAQFECLDQALRVQASKVRRNVGQQHLILLGGRPQASNLVEAFLHLIQRLADADAREAPPVGGDHLRNDPSRGRLARAGGTEQAQPHLLTGRMALRNL